jgi:hypothetical protein
MSTHPLLQKIEKEEEDVEMATTPTSEEVEQAKCFWKGILREALRGVGWAMVLLDVWWMPLGWDTLFVMVFGLHAIFAINHDDAIFTVGELGSVAFQAWFILWSIYPNVFSEGVCTISPPLPKELDLNRVRAALWRCPENTIIYITDPLYEERVWFSWWNELLCLLIQIVYLLNG